ncbi:MAG: peptidoglycan DD-metalloendopeptidase family protein [Armatimonadota bacterium]|nr:peptidoglycan DD-metalloendopeptidase family protein [bacterium]
MLNRLSKITRFTAIPLALIVVLALGVSGFCAAKNKSKLNNDLRSVEKKIRFYRKELRKKEGERRTATGELYSTQRDLASAQTILSKNKLKLMDATTDLKATIARLERTQKQLDRRESLLQNRVVDIYEGEGLDYVNVVLGAANMWSFLTRAYYLQRILDSDASLIKQIREDKAAIEKDKAHQQQKVNEIGSLGARLELQRNKIAVLADTQQQALDSIEHDKNLMQNALDELEAKSREIENRIRSFQRSSRGRARYAKAFKGGLSMPCGGRITCPFGYRVHPITKVYKLHTGVDIGVRSGTAVHSAAAGEVIMAGWMGAYGYAVVIDHGGGVSTLYGHNSRLLVKSGQNVSKGQVIAKSGSTGYSTGPHVHFEKRVNGTPVNPF